MHDEGCNYLKIDFDNVKQSLSREYIQIAGSAHETTDLGILKYSHELIRYLTRTLLNHGAKLIVAAGSDDMVDPENPSWEMALYYDWDVLETMDKYWDSLTSDKLFAGEPLAIIVSSEKAESQIPRRRRDLWDRLIQNEMVHLVRLPAGWNSGAYRREREAEYGAGLIILGGGEGVEHSSQLYVNSKKTVIPIDLPIDSRYRDGKGGAPEISRDALSNPSNYLGPVDNGATRLLNISTKNGNASIQQIGPTLLQLLAEAVANSRKKIMETPEKDPRKVFVVHGRNEKLRKSMFHFLRSIGLEPIEWTEAIQWTGSGSPHVDDILHEAFKRAQATVVLLTPDDEARLKAEFLRDNDPPHEQKLTLQPRANVIFEAGMARGLDPRRTVLVEIGKLRPFSDIVGLHTVRLDDSTGKRQDLAKRLQIAGCDVHLDGTDWHDAGEFQINDGP